MILSFPIQKQADRIMARQNHGELNAETQRNAEKRREKDLSANLCESLRLCVKSSQPASKAGYSSAEMRREGVLPSLSVFSAFPRVLCVSALKFYG